MQLILGLLPVWLDWGVVGGWVSQGTYQGHTGQAIGQYIIYRSQGPHTRLPTNRYTRLKLQALPFCPNRNPCLGIRNSQQGREGVRKLLDPALGQTDMVETGKCEQEAGTNGYRQVRVRLVGHCIDLVTTSNGRSGQETSHSIVSTFTALTVGIAASSYTFKCYGVTSIFCTGRFLFQLSPLMKIYLATF